MREIKFRAWVPEIDRMRVVLSIELGSGDEDVYTRIPIVAVWDHESVRTAKIKGHVARYPRSELKVMQYTGLHDKNGKEVYEGDVLAVGKFGQYELAVLGGIHWTLIPTNEDHTDDHDFLGNYECEDIEVIGNIHENPELLKENK